MGYGPLVARPHIAELEWRIEVRPSSCPDGGEGKRADGGGIAMLMNLKELQFDLIRGLSFSYTPQTESERK